MVLLSPEVSQFLKLVPDTEVEAFIGPLDLEAKDVIATAINNEMDPSKPGKKEYISECILKLKTDQSFLYRWLSLVPADLFWPVATVLPPRLQPRDEFGPRSHHGQKDSPLPVEERARVGSQLVL